MTSKHIYKLKQHPSYYADMPHTAISKQDNNPHTPYTYLIGWSKLDIWYYGVRFKVGCHPSEFFNLSVNKKRRYTTSSYIVPKMIQEHGQPDIIQIRQIFNSAHSAIAFENKTLRRLKVKTSQKWINKTDTKGNTLKKDLISYEDYIKSLGFEDIKSATNEVNSLTRTFTNVAAIMEQTGLSRKAIYKIAPVTKTADYRSNYIFNRTELTASEENTRRENISLTALRRLGINSFEDAAIIIEPFILKFYSIAAINATTKITGNLIRKMFPIVDTIEYNVISAEISYNKRSLKMKGVKKSETSKLNRAITMSTRRGPMFGRSGINNPRYGKPKLQHPMQGKHHSDEAKHSMSVKKRGYVYAFDIINLEFIRITKIEFDTLKGIRYVGQTAKIATEYKLDQNRAIESIHTLASEAPLNLANGSAAA